MAGGTPKITIDLFVIPFAAISTRLNTVCYSVDCATQTALAHKYRHGLCSTNYLSQTKFRSIKSALVVVSLCVLVSACADSSSDAPDTISFVPPEGFPLADGAAVVVAQNRAFSLSEDSSLQGILETNSAPGSDSVAQATTSIESFFVTEPPAFGTLELDEISGEFSYTPEPDYFGLDSFRYYVIADGLGSNQATVNLSIANVNDPPQLVVELDRVVEQGSNYSLRLQGSDIDREPLIYEASNLPGWLTLDVDTGLLRGQPQQTDVGIYREIGFSVIDAGGLRAEAGPFALEVLDINDPPEINPAQFPSSLDAGERVVVNLFPDDPDGDFVILQSEFNDFANVEILGGSLALTAGEVVDVTAINLVVIAEDLLGSTSREIIPITIFPVTASGQGRTLRGRSGGAGLHLVVMAEGYKEDEANTFRADVENLIAMMEEDPAIEVHMDAWNIHSIMVPSVNSGIDDDVTRDFRDTAFDAGYFCRGIQRLICANDALVFDEALDEYPQLDQIVLLVNDPRFGGSGGAIAITSSSAPEIALHELGHSIAGLADEYVDNLIPETLGTRFVEGRYANVSNSSDPLDVPWAHWIDDVDDFPTLPRLSGVGIFEGAFYQAREFYRPTSNSRMRENLAHFGPVNGEQWALSVYQRTNPIIDFSPVTRLLTVRENESQIFTVTPIFDNSVQSISWFVDDEELISARGSRELELQRETGQYNVALEVRDVSGTIRVESPNVSEFRWQWIMNVVSPVSYTHLTLPTKA